MSVWDRIRLPFLVIILSGTLLALGQGILSTQTQKKPELKAFSFPEQVPLARWQQLNSSPLASLANKSQQPLASKRYQYRQNTSILTIEMRYLRVGTGEIQNWLRYYTSLPSSFVVHQHKGIGAYGLFVHQQKIYLTSCINPQGGSTVTVTQYFQNKFFGGEGVTRFFPWLLGQDELFDQRCLWANLSVPLTKSSQVGKNIDPDLKQAWISWYTWWRSHFPQP